MLRRDFALYLLATVAALPALAQRVAPKEGAEYVRLGKPVPVETPAGQIRVATPQAIVGPEVALYLPPDAIVVLPEE